MDSIIEELLKSSSRLVGTKQVMKGLSDGIVKCVILSSDADSFIKNKIVDSARKHSIEIVFYEDRQKLGKLCGIDVGAAVVGLINK